MRHRSPLRSLSLLFVGLAAACSGGDGGGGGDGFQLVRISLPENAAWKINQEIVFTFSQEVDFSSVSLNTINIQTASGAPATGSFSLRAANQVVFQPTCPLENDLSDAGLQPGGLSYVLKVLGESSGTLNTVRSSLGEALRVTQVRNFTTPTDSDPQAVFLDTVQGPPQPVIRPAGSTVQAATYLEIGGDPANRVYFERNASQQIELSVPGFALPLNLYSDPASRVAVVVEFNQALSPTGNNVSDQHLWLERQDSLGVWHRIDTRVTLVQNCSQTGARVRLEPNGVLPQGMPDTVDPDNSIGKVRVVVDQLADIVGDQTATLDGFAVAPTREVEFTSLSPADELSDELQESFDFGGDGALSFEDTQALFDAPTADWGSGRLSAAFDFDGTGGPSGTFDWVVLDGDSIVVDTDAGSIVGSDGITVQTITNGRIDVRDMRIDQGGTVRVQGSKPLSINATGDVIIRGTLDVSGFNARDVVLPNSGNRAEVGGAPGPGGGRGGNASEVVTNSTPRGGFGQGPGVLNGGGQGGESGFAAASAGKDARRPGGGAGGRFAPNQGLGLSAEAGFAGSALAKGAVTGNSPPSGGVLSTGPFTDNPALDNNFFGRKALGMPGNVTGQLVGELPRLWGGYGGGGGGDALPSTIFPTPNWTAASDEKGGAGGGGGGALHIRALGKIQFGVVGQIKARGGLGATGENVLVQDHVGGNGGSGSGGHVILETASYLDFTDGGLDPGNREWIDARGGARVTGVATPAGNVSFGGAGGPGVIQLHVPESLVAPAGDPMVSDIVLASDALLSPDPIDAVTSPAAEVLIPSFGSRSLARSEWIPIGAAGEKPSGVPSLVRFLFGGIDTTAGADEGKVLVSGDEVAELTPLLDDQLGADAVVLPDRVTLELDGAALAPFSGTTGGLSNAIYLRNPDLLQDYVLRLAVASESQDFRVTSAAYDEGAAGLGDESLAITVSDALGDLQDFVSANSGLGTIGYQLIPRFFRVVTGGVENALPTDAFVRIRFQAAADDGSGAPDGANPLVDWTADISQFNGLAPTQLKFFRFEVEFDLATGGAPVTTDTQPVTLDFLKVPFVF